VVDQITAAGLPHTEEEEEEWAEARPRACPPVASPLTPCTTPTTRCTTGAWHRTAVCPLATACHPATPVGRAAATAAAGTGAGALEGAGAGAGPPDTGPPTGAAPQGGLVLAAPLTTEDTPPGTAVLPLLPRTPPDAAPVDAAPAHAVTILLRMVAACQWTTCTVDERRRGPPLPDARLDPLPADTTHTKYRLRCCSLRCVVLLPAHKDRTVVAVK